MTAEKVAKLKEIGFGCDALHLADGGNTKRKVKRRKLGDAEKEASAKKTRVSSRAKGATSNGDGRFVGIENPTGNKLIAQWNGRYGELMEYKQKHGDCNVPK